MESLTKLVVAAAVSAVVLTVSAAKAVQHGELKRRGDAAMGFDQDKTTHHFKITSGGGVIQVEANDPADRVSRDAIRVHLSEISKAFARGDFEKPFATHAEVVDWARHHSE